LALRAGVNCGHCENVGQGGDKNCNKHAVCQEWGLHRFRKTFASKHYQHNSNRGGLRVIQRWLGHHSLDVTIRYLADEEDTAEPIRKQVNDTFAVFARVAPAHEATIQ
jgi:integrase